MDSFGRIGARARHSHSMKRCACMHCRLANQTWHLPSRSPDSQECATRLDRPMAPHCRSVSDAIDEAKRFDGGSLIGAQTARRQTVREAVS
eukprot:6204895-Pleurochrysis_carterae.AAC.2